MKKETRGRKTRLDAALAKRICKLLEQGCDQKTACNLAGVPYSTYNEWKERGQKGEALFASFFSVISRARDAHKLRLINIVIAAADADARHAEWLLERMWPKEFGRSEPRTIVIERSEAPQMSPPVVEKSHEWRKDANVPPELVQYLGVLSNGEGNGK